MVLIAGGVGITPLLSMLHQCLAASPASRPVTLIQGALNSRVHPFREEVRALAAAHPNLQVHVRHEGERRAAVQPRPHRVPPGRVRDP